MFITKLFFFAPICDGKPWLESGPTTGSQPFRIYSLQTKYRISSSPGKIDYFCAG